MIDAHPQLLRAIHRLAPLAAMPADRGTTWASATFEGMRHRLSLLVNESDADRLTSLLPNHEFELRDHFVADMLVADRIEESGGVLLAIEALTIELH